MSASDEIGGVARLDYVGKYTWRTSREPVKQLASWRLAAFVRQQHEQQEHAGQGVGI